MESPVLDALRIEAGRGGQSSPNPPGRVAVIARRAFAFLLAAGVVYALIDFPHRHGAGPRRVADRVAEAAALGEAATLWDMLTIASKLRVDAEHRGRLGTAWKSVKDSGVIAPESPLVVEANRLTSLPADRAWQERLLAVLGPESRRAAFQEYRVTSVEVDGPRAVVRGTLADGTPQTLRLVRTEAGWRLEGFEPYS